MKTSLEDISSVKKKLTVEIESDKVEKSLDKAYKDLARKAKVKGFRKGKTPRSILERNYSSQVEDDVCRELINNTFPEVLNEHKTFPLGAPDLDFEGINHGMNFTYTAVFEVRPEFELENYTGLKIDKEKVNITDEHVEKQLQMIQTSSGKLISVEEDRPVMDEDTVVIDYVGFDGDEAIQGITAENYNLKIGSGSFYPKFEEALIGLNKGTEYEIEVNFDEKYSRPALAGKNVRFKVKIKEIKVMQLPELNDEFIKGLGDDLKNVNDLRSKIKESLIFQEEKRIERDLKRRLIKKITGSVEFELPQVLVESEIDYAVQNIRQNFSRSGISFENAGISLDKLREDFKPASEKRVKEMLVLSEIAKKETIAIDEKDIDNGYEELALSMGQSPEFIKQVYNNKDFYDFFEQKLLEEKTLNYLVEHATINDVESTVLNN